MNRVDNLIRDSYLDTRNLDIITTIHIQTEIEKWMISTIYAPIKKNKIKKMKQSFKKQVSQIGDDAHSAMLDMCGQLDKSLQGKFSAKVQSVMEKEAEKFKKI